MSQETPESSSRIVIDADKIETRYWRDIWRYRELFYFLAWRDILVRYKQTAIGVAWSVLRPVLTMLIFTVVFGKIAKLPDGGIPYPILVFSALLPWQFFANSLTESSASLIGNANMISKVYFPRLVLPTSSIIVALVDFGISVVILFILMAILQFPPSINLLALPLFALMTFVAALGPGLLFAALNVKYRDFRYIVPFVVQMGLYISPVGFRSDIVPESYRFLYGLNPMVGVIDGFRWAICGAEAAPFHLPTLLCSISTSAILLIAGIVYFRKTERNFADVI